MVKLKLLEKLNTNQKEMRGITPLAISNAGVLVAEDDGDLSNTDEGAALELTDPADAFDPLPELNGNLPFHLYAVCSSGGGKSTYVGRLAQRFKDITNQEGTVIVISAEENEDPAIDHDVRFHVDRCADMTLDDLAGEIGDDGEPERTWWCSMTTLAG